jgi:protein-disulfide isomerase
VKNLIVALLLCASGIAAAAQPPSQDTEAIIKRLEESGALDQAIDRGIQRYIQHQQDAQRQEQEAAQNQRLAMAKNARKPDPKTDHILGQAGAEVSIIEYSDFECPFCKSFHGVPQEAVKRFGGKVNLVWRHFPLDFHNPAAQKEAEASVCAAKLGGNDAFWKYADTIMARTGSNGKGIPPADGNPLVTLAREIKLDPGAFQKCLDAPDTRQRVADDIRDGAAAGVSGTPGIIIRNNKTGKSLVAPGAVPVEMVESLIRQAMAP